MMTDPEQRQLHTAVNEALWRTTVCGPTLTCLEAADARVVAPKRRG